MNFFKSAIILPAVALALALYAPSIARAQPDPNNAPKAENPENRDARRRRPTAEEREARIARYIKEQVARTGVTDEAQQDAVVEYIRDEVDAREELREESRTLGTALRNKTLGDAQVAGLLNSYMVAVEDDRARRKEAQKKLGEALDILTVPRLEAMLSLMGLWGDAPDMGGNNFGGRGRNRNRRAN